MKTILKTGLTAVAIMLSINVSAQTSPFSFGVKGGVNLSNYRGDIDDTKAKVGFNIGLTVELALPSDLYLLSGLELTTKGAKNFEQEVGGELYTKLQSVHGGVDWVFPEGYKIKVECTQNAMYLQLPMHLGYKMNVLPDMKLSVHAGPYVAYGIGGKVKFDNEVWLKDTYGNVLELELTEELIELLNRRGLSKEHDTFGDAFIKEFDFGLGFGVGAEFGKIGVNLGYDLGLTNISRDKDEKINTMNAHLSLGYKF